MALGALSLSVTQGVQGRPFAAAISGLTTGRVEVLQDGSPGFYVANGILRSNGLPYPVSTAVLREYDPGAGAGYLDTRLEITATTQQEASAIALASMGAGRTLQGYTVAGTVQNDGSIVYSVYARDELGATVATSVGSGSIIAPAFTLQRVSETTPLFTKANIGGMSSLTTKGPYFPQVVDVRGQALYDAAGIAFVLVTSTDHDSGSPANGGRWHAYCYRDDLDPEYPLDPANWVNHDTAYAEGKFAAFSGTVATGNPVKGYSSDRQVETFWTEILSDNSWFSTFQIYGSSGFPQGQLSIRMTSDNGGQGWSVDPTTFMLPPSPEAGSNSADTNNHTGYQKFHNLSLVDPDGYLVDVDHQWLSYGLAIDGESSVQAYYGTDDLLSNSWTWLSHAGAQQGRAVFSLPPPKSVGPYRVGFPIGWRYDSQGRLMAITNCSSSSFGTNPTTSVIGEYVISTDGKEAISQVRTILTPSTVSGSYAEGSTGISNLIDMGDYIWGIEIGRNAANNANALGLVFARWADFTEETNLPDLFPAIPTGLTEVRADYTTLTAVPTGITEVGASSPTRSYAATGKDVTVDGAATPQGQHIEYGTTPFTLQDSRYVDIDIQGLRSVGTNSRYFQIGFTTAALDTAVDTSDGIWLESSPSRTKHYIYKAWRRSGQTFRSVVDTMSVGNSGVSEALGNGVDMSNYNKIYGIRLWIDEGYISILGAGGIEVDHYTIPPLLFLDPAASYRPFVSIKGVAASSVERFMSWGSRRKAGAGANKLYHPYEPLVFANYAHNQFKVGDDLFDNITDFRADPRVTQMDPDYGLDMIDMSSLLSGGGTSSGTAQVVHSVTTPAATCNLLFVDDGPADGEYNDAAIRMAMTSARVLLMQAFVGGSASRSTQANAPTLANGEFNNAVVTFSPSALTTNLISGVSGIFTGSSPTGLNRLIIGGRPDNSALKYSGSIKYVAFWPENVTKTACDYYGAMA